MASLRLTSVTGVTSRSSVNVILQGTLFKPELDVRLLHCSAVWSMPEVLPVILHPIILRKYCVYSLLSTYFLAVSCSCCTQQPVPMVHMFALCNAYFIGLCTCLDDQTLFHWPVQNEALTQHNREIAH